jgi:hypothetical protein
MSARCQQPTSPTLLNHLSCARKHVGGMVIPSALAILRLTASSYLVGACTGRSAGFSPLRMRSRCRPAAHTVLRPCARGTPPGYAVRPRLHRHKLSKADDPCFGCAIFTTCQMDVLPRGPHFTNFVLWTLLLISIVVGSTIVSRYVFFCLNQKRLPTSGNSVTQ